MCFDSTFSNCFTASIDKCNICNRKVRPTKSHFCPSCKTRSHAKCNSIESKHLHEIWLCKSCRDDIFPFSEEASNKPQLQNLSNLKSYFSQLNNLNSFGSLDQDENIEEIISTVNIKVLKILKLFLVKNIFLFFNQNVDEASACV